MIGCCMLDVLCHLHEADWWLSEGAGMYSIIYIRQDGGCLLWVYSVSYTRQVGGCLQRVGVYTVSYTFVECV